MASTTSSGPTQDRVAQLPHHRGVRRRVGAAVAGGEAATHLGQHAGRPRRLLGEPVGALPHRERVVQRVQAPLGGLLGGERAEVVGVVVEHPAHQGEPRPRLAGELDEVHLLGEPRAAVVARLVLGDQAQLADLGLQRRRALDAGHRGREVDHLAHPGAGLGGGEVGADAGPQVARRADVEDPGPVVAEEVDAGGVGESLGEVALAPLGRADPRRERRQLLERVHAEAAEALHQAVQHVDGRPRVGEGAVVGRGAGVEEHRERRQLAVGGVVPGDHPARQLGGVDHLEGRPRPPLPCREVLEEADVERRVVRHQHAALRELQERGQRRLDGRRVGDHRVGDAGQDRDERRDLGVRVHQGLELAEDLAAAHLDRTDLGDHRAGLGRPAGGLEVDDAERDVAQRSAQLVETALRLPSGGRTLNRAAHVEDARCGHRQFRVRRAHTLESRPRPPKEPPP